MSSPTVCSRGPPDLWRYAEALPPLARRVSLGEPMTPLVAVERQGRPVGLKCDFLLPTGPTRIGGPCYWVLQDVTRADRDARGRGELWDSPLADVTEPRSGQRVEGQVAQPQQFLVDAVPVDANPDATTESAP